jgi:glutaminase
MACCDQGLLTEAGILPDDPRLANPKEREALAARASSGQLKIPDFASFRAKVGEVFEEVKPIEGGHNADYIRELAVADPMLFGVALCTVDGQRLSFGDDEVDFTVQSTVKPVLYGMAIEAYGEAEVHRFVGREPSGVAFNKVSLNKRGVPHNPVNNAGAIVTASLLCDPKEGNAASHYKRLKKTYEDLTGGLGRIGFSKSVFDSERETATRNRRIALTIKETSADKPVGFPGHVVTDTHDVERVLDFYFSGCSIETNVKQLSILAATLANGGICPLTGVQVFSPVTVKYVLTVMDTCGMYDYSGEFKNRFGQPAKSGVSGVIVVVIPGELGFAVESPPLDAHHNSFKGLAFCAALWRTFTFHPFDGLVPIRSKTNPFVDRIEDEGFAVFQANQAALEGKLAVLRSLHRRGYSLKDGDYDDRTPMHLAACGGHLEVVMFLKEEAGGSFEVKDRMGSTPLDEARKLDHTKIIEYMESS